jgi:hypothetical protein
MSRLIRYHKREHEKAMVAVKESNARDIDENRAAMAEAFAHSDYLHKLVVDTCNQGKAGMAILETENKTLKARLAASEKIVAAYKHLVDVHDKTLEKHKTILTRAKHLEAHV